MSQDDFIESLEWRVPPIPDKTKEVEAWCQCCSGMAIVEAWEDCFPYEMVPGYEVCRDCGGEMTFEEPELQYVPIL